MHHNLDSGAVEAAMDGQHASLDDFDDVLVVVCPDAKDRALSVSPGNELWPHTAFTTSPNLKMHPPMHHGQGMHPSQPSLSPRTASVLSLYESLESRLKPTKAC